MSNTPTTHFITENLRYLRTKHGLSQEKLADDIGVTRFAIASYEQSRCTPPIETLLRICDYFEVSLDEFIKKDIKYSI